MRAVSRSRQFERDARRIARGGVNLALELDAVIALLETDIPLPEKYHDHALKGAWVPARECHIRPDILLVYRKSPGELRLLRLTSHSELFGR